MADDWITAATAEMNRLNGPHSQKKRNTIIALVDARIAGISEETVWRRSDTCSRSTYHERWKFDETFADVLETVTASARAYNDNRTIRALAQAGERLALASPVAVAKAIERLNSTDEAIILRAAFGILDRAGVETATKASIDSKQEITLSNVDVTTLTDAELEAIIASRESDD